MNKLAISKVLTYYVVLITSSFSRPSLSLSIQYPDPLTSGFELRRGGT